MSTHHSFEELVETKARKKEPLSGPGGRLRLAREQAKLTRADVVDRLRIKLEMVEAIENDDYTDSPSLVFVRGWLRGYAKLVNLPADEIIAIFNQLGITDPDLNRPVYHLAKPVKMKRRGMRWFSILIMLILASLVAIWWHSQKEPPTQLAAYYSMDDLMGDVSIMTQEQTIDDEQTQVMIEFDPDSSIVT
jgi:cytoskeletal protein RodZ